MSLALFGAFVTRARLQGHANQDGPEQVNLMSSVVFAFLMLGVMVPYWFSAMTMKSVCSAANVMVKEVAPQWQSAMRPPPW